MKYFDLIIGFMVEKLVDLCEAVVDLYTKIKG